MALENLFATEPALPNVQKTKMPDAPEKWGEVLTTLVRESFPDCAKLPMTVEFKKKDDQSGTAIGAVHVVSVDAGKSIYIPFIINNFQLSPLDVWMEKKTQAVHPLTKDTFKQIFFVRNAADGMDARPSDSAGQYFNDPSMWTNTYPPLQGRYSYASAGYHILDQIADTMTEEDLNNFKEALKQEPTLLQKFASHGHGDLIKKLAAKKSTVNTNDYGAAATKLIPKSYIEVKKEGYDKYSILSSADGLYDLATTEIMDRSACEEFLSNIKGVPQDALNEVDQTGEKKMILRPAPEKGVWLYDIDEKTAVDADEFTCYWVKNKNGLMIDALVIPDVVNFSGKKQKGRMVLSRTHSCYQDSVAGVRYPDSKCLTDVLRPQGMRTGQTGVFVYVGENGKAISTLPVTIKAIEDRGRNFIHVVDLNGKSMRVRLGWGSDFSEYKRGQDSVGLKACEPDGLKETNKVTLESLGFAEINPEHFVIPSKMMWIPMEPMTDVTATPKEWLEKTAFQKMDSNPVEVRYTGIVYDFRGGNLPKLAAYEPQARALLVNLGADLNQVNRIIKTAKYKGKATVHGCQTLRTKEDVASNMKKTASAVETAAKSLKKTLIKEASAIDNSATVDAILSLNFMTKDNLAKFVAYVPVFEKAADFLAELTIAHRLGLKQVNEAAVTGAMGKLIETIEGLKRIEASMKRPSTKAV